MSLSDTSYQAPDVLIRTLRESASLHSFFIKLVGYKVGSLFVTLKCRGDLKSLTVHTTKAHFRATQRTLQTLIRINQLQGNKLKNTESNPVTTDL